MNKYSGDWSSYEDVRSELAGSGPYNYDTGKYEEVELPEGFPTDEEIIFAEYNTEPYSGSATLLYEKGKKLFLWSDSHCSCNGLDWRAGDEVTWKTVAAMTWLSDELRGFVEKKVADQEKAQAKSAKKTTKKPASKKASSKRKTSK